MNDKILNAFKELTKTIEATSSMWIQTATCLKELWVSEMVVEESTAKDVEPPVATEEKITEPERSAEPTPAFAPSAVEAPKVGGKLKKGANGIKKGLKGKKAA